MLVVFSLAQAALERIILDPRYHDLLALLKTARNGAVYGTKVRFPHALVYVFARENCLISTLEVNKQKLILFHVVP